MAPRGCQSHPADAGGCATVLAVTCHVNSSLSSLRTALCDRWQRFRPSASRPAVPHENGVAIDQERRPQHSEGDAHSGCCARAACICRVKPHTAELKVAERVSGRCQRRHAPVAKQLVHREALGHLQPAHRQPEPRAIRAQLQR